MLFLICALLAVWLLLVLTAVALCAYARRTDEEIAQKELAPVIEFRSVA